MSACLAGSHLDRLRDTARPRFFLLRAENRLNVLSLAREAQGLPPRTRAGRALERREQIRWRFDSARRLIESQRDTHRLGPLEPRRFAMTAPKRNPETTAHRGDGAP